MTRNPDWNMFQESILPVLIQFSSIAPAPVWCRALPAILDTARAVLAETCVGSFGLGCLGVRRRKRYELVRGKAPLSSSAVCALLPTHALCATPPSPISSRADHRVHIGQSTREGCR